MEKLDDSKLVITGCQAQTFDLLAKKTNIQIVELGLCRLYGNIMGNKYLKQDVELLKEICHQSDSANNVMDIITGQGIHCAEKFVNPQLKMGDGIDVSHN